MGCNCGGAKKKVYVVTLPNGTVVEVANEAQARIEVTKANGGTYKARAA